MPQVHSRCWGYRHLQSGSLVRNFKPPDFTVRSSGRITAIDQYRVNPVLEIFNQDLSVGRRRLREDVSCINTIFPERLG